MIKKIKEHINITVVLNMLCITFSYFLIIQTQKYTTLITHDFIYPWRNLHLRIPAQIFETLFNNFLPNFFNIHPIDMNSGFGLSSIILSGFSVLICIFLAEAFFLFKKSNNILAEKSFLIIYPLSFLLIFNPFRSIFGDYINFFRVEDLAVAAEYYFVLIPFFMFFVIIYKIIFNKYKPSFIEYILYIIIFFILGGYNELANLTSLFSIFLFLSFLAIFDREKLKNKHLWYLICSFIIGFMVFYIIINQFSTDLKMYNANFIQLLKQSFNDFSNGFSEYVQFMIIKNYALYIFILIFCILSCKEGKEAKQSAFFAISIIIGYLLTNFLILFVTGLVPDNKYLFKRDYFNLLYLNVIEFAIFILLGILCVNKAYKKLIICCLLLLLSIFSFTYIHTYKEIQNIKFDTKRLLYNIDKINLIYTILGETSILPASYLDESLNIFIIDNRFKEKDDYKKFSTNKIITNKYYLELFYGKYFETTYKKTLKGIIFKPDDIAFKELNKRLRILNEEMETLETQKKNNVSYKELYKKYKNKKITINDITAIKLNKGESDVITKAEAFVYYRDGYFNKALELYKKYTTNNKDDVDALIYMAEIYKSKNNIQKVKEIYKKLISLDDNNLLFNYNYLQILFNYEKDYIQTLKLCDKMINTEPNLAANYINKGLVYLVTGDQLKAKEMFERGKEIQSEKFEQMLNENNVSNLQELLEKEKETIKLIDACF